MSSAKKKKDLAEAGRKKLEAFRKQRGKGAKPGPENGAASLPASAARAPPAEVPAAAGTAQAENQQAQPPLPTHAEAGNNNFIHPRQSASAGKQLAAGPPSQLSDTGPTPVTSAAARPVTSTVPVSASPSHSLYTAAQNGSVEPGQGTAVHHTQRSPSQSSSSNPPPSHPHSSTFALSSTPLEKHGNEHTIHPPSLLFSQGSTSTQPSTGPASPPIPPPPHLRLAAQSHAASSSKHAAHLLPTVLQPSNLTTQHAPSATSSTQPSLQPHPATLLEPPVAPAHPAPATSCPPSAPPAVSLPPSRTSASGYDTLADSYVSPSPKPSPPSSTARPHSPSPSAFPLADDPTATISLYPPPPKPASPPPTQYTVAPSSAIPFATSTPTDPWSTLVTPPAPPQPLSTPSFTPSTSFPPSTSHTSSPPLPHPPTSFKSIAPSTLYSEPTLAPHSQASPAPVPATPFTSTPSTTVTPSTTFALSTTSAPSTTLTPSTSFNTFTTFVPIHTPNVAAPPSQPLTATVLAATVPQPPAEPQPHSTSRPPSASGPTSSSSTCPHRPDAGPLPYLSEPHNPTSCQVSPASSRTPSQPPPSTPSYPYLPTEAASPGSTAPAPPPPPPSNPWDIPPPAPLPSRDTSESGWGSESTRKQMKELQAHVSELTERRLELERGLASAGRTNEALQQENDALAERFNSQAREVADLKGQLAAIAKEQEAQRIALAATARERDSARMDVREARERANALAKEVVGLEQELLAAKADRIRAQNALRSVADSADATACAEAAEAAAATAERRSAAAEAAAAAADARAAAAEGRTAAAEAAEAAAAQARRAAETEAPGAQAVEEARAAAAAAEAEKRAAVARLGAALRHAEQLEAELAEAHIALAGLQGADQGLAHALEHRPSTPSPPPALPHPLGSPTSSTSSSHLPPPSISTRDAGVQCILSSNTIALPPISTTAPATPSHPPYPQSPYASYHNSSPPTSRLSTPGGSEAMQMHRATATIAGRALSTAPHSPASTAAAGAGDPSSVLLSALAAWLPASGLEGPAAAGEQQEDGVVSEASRAAAAIVGLLGELEGELMGLRRQLAAKQVESRQLEVANEQLHARLQHQTQRLDLLQKMQSHGQAPTGSDTPNVDHAAYLPELPTTPSSAPPGRKSGGWGLAWFRSPPSRDQRIRTTLL